MGFLFFFNLKKKNNCGLERSIVVLALYVTEDDLGPLVLASTSLVMGLQDWATVPRIWNFPALTVPSEFEGLKAQENWGGKIGQRLSV